MSKYYLKRTHHVTKRKLARIIGLGIAVLGLVNLFYFFFPLLSWQIFFAPVFAQQNVVAPVPISSRVNLDTIGSLFSHTVNSFRGVDYTDARNWFPDYNVVGASPSVTTYTLSIPKLKIENAEVTTVDNDLKQHLVNYAGTAVPPEKGNAVIYGHSTLPQLFNQKDYTTIFATLHTIKPGDTIDVTVNSQKYTYRITKITVVEAEDTSVLTQDFSDSYLTLITCTPPGTLWKRLVVTAVREKI